MALKDRNEERKNDFSRADVLLPRFVDEATWYNLRSVGIFGSTVRGEMVDVMGDLGYYTGANEYLYYGATPVTNALFGVRHVYTRENDYINTDSHMFVKDSEPSGQGKVTLYENPYTLPIGYMVNDEILDFETLDNGPFTVQNELCGALTGVEPIFVSIFDDMNVNAYGTNMDITLVDDNNATYKNANESARGDMIYTVPEDMDLYMSCRGSNVHKIALLIDGKERAYDRYQGQIFHIGKMKAGQKVDIQFELNDDAEELSGDLYCYPMKYLGDQFSAFYNSLLGRGMQVDSVSDTKITGKIYADGDDIFMTSIPYDDGWKIICDGKEVETYILLEAFLGADIPEGEHDIEIIYHSPGMREGMIITLVGIVLFLVLIYIESRENDYIVE